MSDEKTYEMLWDCPRCGTEKLLGLTHRHCPSCGSAQDPEKRYFPDDEDKVAVEDHVYAGADIICAYCDSPNGAAVKHCGGCGAPVAESGTKAGLVDEPNEPDEPHGDDSGEHVDDKGPPSRPKGGGCLLKGGIAAVILAVIMVVATVLLWTRGTTVEVVGHDWTRQIAIERYDRVSRADWCDRLPVEAESVRRSERERSTRQVPDGEDCRTVRRDRGDGTFAERQECTTRYRSEPVYDQWCDYRIRTWDHYRYATAEGQGLTPEPHWPRVEVDNCTRLGCTREGRRRTDYRVHFREPGGTTHRCSFDQSRWSRAEVGSVWEGSAGVIGGGLRCGSLSRRSP